MQRLILASGSPRRRELLSQRGLEFEVIPSPAEEIHDEEMPLHELCETNARIKAEDVARKHPEATLIGADTLVYIDGRPLGKPRNEDESVRMLETLSGRVHQVCTGVCIVSPEGTDCFHCVTDVEFKPLTRKVIDEYRRLVNVMDKAGSYGAQDYREMIIEAIHGSYENVVGLPVDMVLERLEHLG